MIIYIIFLSQRQQPGHMDVERFLQEKIAEKNPLQWSLERAMRQIRGVEDAFMAL